MKKLRLIVTDQCNRHCAGCCNRDFDMLSVPVLIPHRVLDQDIKDWDEVLITGGEPMLVPELTRATANRVPSTKKVILYTAEVGNLIDMRSVIGVMDGVTVTLHEDSDVDAFARFHCAFIPWCRLCQSCRLNVFAGVTLPDDLDLYKTWQIKRDIVWLKNCPLPADEVLMRLPGVGE